MKKLTFSKAVNAEISAIQSARKVSQNTSTENKVFITLGVLVALAIVINVLVYGVPNI